MAEKCKSLFQSHYGDILKSTVPSWKNTSEMGREHPLSPSKYPTDVLTPDNLTSSYDGKI
tara:strand:- start:7695 stop:7874 length:180 start_codon:yes stop_codon:yes gene_type:complete